MLNQSMVPTTNTLGGNAQMAAELQKAITVGYPNMPGSTGSALQAQALDPVVTNLAFQADELALRRKLVPKNVQSTVQQYAELGAYGTGDFGQAFLREVDVPSPNDAPVASRYTTLKHMGRQGSVSFAAMQTAGGSIVEPLNFETRNLIMQILQNQEECHLYGNSALNPLEYDGLLTQMLARAPEENVRDLRGQSLSQDEIMHAGSVVGKKGNHGTLTDLFLNIQCKGDLGRQLINQQRNFINGAGAATSQGLTLGLDPKFIQGVKGLIELNMSPFITDGGSPPMTTTGLPQFAPAVPTIGTATAGAPGAGQNSSFSTTADVGDVSYIVVASNSKGTAAPVYVTPGSTVDVAQGQVVSFTITPGAGNLPDYYAIYRTPTNSRSVDLSDHKLIQKVPNNVDGIAQNSTVTVVDQNDKLPGTYDALALDLTPGRDFVNLLQTGPMARVPMGITQTAFSFMVTHTLAMQLRAPRRAFYWKNVGLLGSLPTPV